MGGRLSNDAVFGENHRFTGFGLIMNDVFWLLSLALLDVYYLLFFYLDGSCYGADCIVIAGQSFFSCLYT